jgi:hypothetical protein
MIDAWSDIVNDSWHESYFFFAFFFVFLFFSSSSFFWRAREDAKSSDGEAEKSK